MPLIKVDEVVRKEFDLLPEGDYECIIEKYDTPAPVNGDDASRVQFLIREDVHPTLKGRKLFSNIRASWGWAFSAIGAAVNIPKGTEFETLADFLNEVKGKAIRLTVKHKPYNGKTYANVTAFKPSTAPAIVDDEEGSIV